MAQEPQSDIQRGALWRLRATCVADLFLRDVESADSQDPGRGLMGTGYFVQAVGGYCTTSPNNLFVLLVPASPDSRTDPCPLLALHTTFFKLCVPPEKPPPRRGSTVPLWALWSSWGCHSYCLLQDPLLMKRRQVRGGRSRVDPETPCPVENPPASPPAPPTHNLNLSFSSTVYEIKWGSWGASLCYCPLNVGDSPQFIFPETTRALC